MKMFWGSACNGKNEIWTQLNACQEGNKPCDFPGGPGQLRLPFSAAGICLTLVVELRSHMPQGN